MLRRIARELAAFAFFLAVAVAMTWPLAIRMRTTVADPGDPLGNAWIVNWVAHALLHAPLDLFQSPLYYPSRLALAFSENLVGVVLWVLPFHAAGFSPITVYNIALLLGFAFSGYGMFVLARMITGSTPGALVAGIIVAFVPFKFDHLSHMQLQWSGWIPLLLAAVLWYWRAPSPRRALLIAGAFAMNGLTNVHYFLFGSFAAVATVFALALFDPRKGRRFWVTLAGAFVIGGLVLLPFLLPYRIVANEYKMKRDQWAARSGSAPMKAWLVATPRSVVYGKVADPAWQRHEFQLWPGLVAIALALYGWKRSAPAVSHEPKRRPWIDASIAVLAVFAYFGAVTDRIAWHIGEYQVFSFDSADVPLMLIAVLLAIRLARPNPEAAERRVALLWILIGFVGSLGMNAFLHGFLHRRIGVFQAIRAPVRWAVIAYIGLAVFAAFGVKRSRRAAALVLIPLAALDLWPSIRWEHVRTEVPPVYRWLRDAKIAPLIELPAGGMNEFHYVLGSTAHHLPQFNGIEAVGHAAYRRLRQKLDLGEYDAEALELLERHGCRLVVVHAHGMPPEGRQWLKQHLARGRLAFLRSFDHEIGGDFVFAVTRNLRDWQRLRGPNVPDGAGHLPEEKLARMLVNQPVHSDAIMWALDTPQSYQHVKGKLHVSGWALSPFAIKRVTVLLDDATVRVDAALVDRPDVSQRYVWYYFVPKPGFLAVIDPRPRGVPRSTNVQVEIEDEGGRVVRTEAVVIDWDP